MNQNNGPGRATVKSRSDLETVIDLAAKISQVDNQEPDPIFSFIKQGLPERDNTPQSFARHIEDAFTRLADRLRDKRPDLLYVLPIIQKSTLYFIKQVLTDKSWSAPLDKLENNSITVEGVPHASAKIIDIKDPKVAAAYLKQVDDMARWIVKRVRDAGLGVPDSVLSDPPSFHYGQIEATGAIGIVFEQAKIEIWTPFGMFAASSFFDEIPSSVVEKVKEQFGLKEVSGDLKERSFMGRKVYVATIDADGEALSPVLCGSSTHDYLRNTWDEARPNTRCRVGEEHCLLPADRERMRSHHNAIAAGKLQSNDAEQRLDAFSDLVTAGPDFLPILITCFANERDQNTQNDMLTELIKYKEILADQPHFGPAVATWLDGQISKSDESDKGRSLHNAYWALGDLRRVGPIVPEQMVPILIRMLDLYESPQWPLDYLATYGKAAEAARAKVASLLDSEDANVRSYAAQVMASLDL
jgi:hypothetical protein